jgi:Type IV secretion system pilin
MNTPTTFGGLVNFFIEFINIVITALLALAFLVLIWKIIDAWIIHADDEKKRAEGKSYALTAVIVFVVMVSVWGILQLLVGAA